MSRCLSEPGLVATLGANARRTFAENFSIDRLGKTFARLIEQAEEKAMTPLISVLMPVYNPDLKFLEEAIESVRGQTHENWELCIADDRSTDERVRPFLEEMAQRDSRLKIVFREANGGIAACSNSALALAERRMVRAARPGRSAGGERPRRSRTRERGPS